MIRPECEQILALAEDYSIIPGMQRNLCRYDDADIYADPAVRY